jgi:hypothetical protein
VIGEKFERLMVIDRAESKAGKRQWRCRCDCGSEVIVPTGALRSGNTKSCGCLSRDRVAQRNRDRKGAPAVNRADLTGQRFGRLTVVALDGYRVRESGRGTRKGWWRCSCDCGAETIVSTDALRSGNTTSCGCYQKEQAIAATKRANTGVVANNRADLAGRRFGQLVVKAHAHTKTTPLGHSLAYWRAVCDCGNETVVSRNNLKSGEVQSCGCGTSRPSSGENEVADFIRAIDPEVETNRKLSDVRGFRYDVVSEKHRIVVEFNGVFWHSAAKVEKDYHKIKREAAESAGYRMITIWQDEWINDRARFEDLLSRAFGAADVVKIGARKLSVVELSAGQALAHHRTYHVQKNPLAASFHFGLVDSAGLLIAAASFRKIGDVLDLSRYTVRQGYSVAGGLARLCKQCAGLADKVVTYVDLDHFDGRGYLAAGFKHTGFSLQMSYLRGSDRVNRQQFMRHKLTKLGIDVQEGESERAALERANIFQCWNSGTDRYELSLT